MVTSYQSVKAFSLESFPTYTVSSCSEYYCAHLFRRTRHLSDPPYAEVSSPPARGRHSPQASLSVGVSPATTLAAAHSSFSYGIEEQELRQKLESSLKKEKALSQR